MNGTLSGFLISGLFSFKVSFLGMDFALEIWLFTPEIVFVYSSSVDLVSKKSSFEQIRRKWRARL